MSRRRPPSRERSDVQGPPQLDELFAFAASTDAQLAERYGSLERAHRREDWLFETGILREGRHEQRNYDPDAGGVELIDGRDLGEM